MARSSTGETDPVVRKAQLTGGSTFTVSLPKDWAEGQDLEAGSELWLYALEDRVVVAPAARAADGTEATVAADGLAGEALARRIRAAYTAGAEAIAVTARDGLDDDQHRTATRTLEGLVGLDVGRGTDGTVEARSLLDTADVSLAQTLAQLRRVTTSMHADAAEAVATGDADRAATVRRRRGDVDRLVALVHRQFAGALVDVTEVERLETDRAAAFRQFRTARRLGSVATHGAAIAALVPSDDGTGPPAPVPSAVRDAGGQLSDLVAAALDGPPEVAERERAALTERVDDLERAVRGGGVDPVRLGRITERYASAGRTATGLTTVCDPVTDSGDH